MSSRYFFLKLIVLFIVIAAIITALAWRTPKAFPVGSEFPVPQNISLGDIADTLAEKHIITSPFLFKSLVVAFHGQRGIVAGDYVFSKKEDLLTVVDRLTKGDQQLVPVKVTIPEGSTLRDVAGILLKKMPHFDAPYFVRLAHDDEGYLFPDTYLFYPNQTVEEILKTLHDTFDAKIKGLATDIQFSRHTQKDIVIMASLIEKEASSTSDRLLISGILWKRLDEGMPLQVDSSLVYITGNSSVSLDDTKIDSPYNTYKNKGLPKGPISNPGLDALTTAAHPLQSRYYYYLSDAKGNIHYATTFDQHLANKKKYLQ